MAENKKTTELSITRSSENAPYLHLLLQSSLTRETKERKLYYSTLPSTGASLKELVEREFKIPVCVQTASFNSNIIQEDTKLNYLRVQEGDTIVIEYPYEIDTQLYIELKSDIVKVLSLLKTIIPKIAASGKVASDIHNMLKSDCKSVGNVLINLADDDQFVNTTSGMPEVGQLFFIHNGGLKVLVELYKLLHLLPWHQLPMDVQQFEHSCLYFMCALNLTIGTRYLLLREGALQCVLKSLLRIKLEPMQYISVSEPLADPLASKRMSNWILGEAIAGAILSIGK